MNLICKGEYNPNGKCYTTFGKSYNIHTFTRFKTKETEEYELLLYRKKKTP